MNAKLFLLTAGMVIFLAACSNEAIVQPEDKITGGELSVVATGTDTYAGAGDRTVVFNGNDIKSFNLTTGELIFSNLTFEQLRSRTENYTLTFYLGDRELFKSASIGFDSLLILSGTVINDLVFILRGDMNERLYLMDGFPGLDWIKRFGATVEEAATEREANAQKRKAEWDLFIEYLKDAGKMIEEPSYGNPGNSIPDDTLRLKDIGYIVDYAGCDGYGEAFGYYIITENQKDTLVTYNLPDGVYTFPQSFYDNPEPYRYSYGIAFTYRLAAGDEKRGAVCPAMYQPHRLYWNKESTGEEKQVIIISAGKIGGGEPNGGGNGGDYPAKIEIRDYAPEGCGWTTKNVTADSLYVIRSVEEFRTLIDCPETNVPAIDFDRYSLLFVHGWATNGINDITKNLQQTSATGYVLNVEIFLNATKIAPRWDIAVLTPKLPQNATVGLNKNSFLNNPSETEIWDYTLKDCGWETNNVIADSIYVIRSVEELRTLVSCPETIAPVIDFDSYSLLFVHGRTLSGIAGITKYLQRTSATEYVLNVEITLNAASVVQPWNIAVLIRKLPQNVAVRLNRNDK
jgi:hypothetical protein